MAYEEEVRHVPDGDGGNFGQDPKGGTTSVAREGDPTKSRYLNFDPGRMSTIKWIPKGGQLSESRKSNRRDPNLDPSQKPTGSSAIQASHDINSTVL